MVKLDMKNLEPPTRIGNLNEEWIQEGPRVAIPKSGCGTFDQSEECNDPISRDGCLR